MEREKIAREDVIEEQAMEGTAESSVDYGRLKDFLTTDPAPSGYKQVIEEMTNYVVQSKEHVPP